MNRKAKNKISYIDKIKNAGRFFAAVLVLTISFFALNAIEVFADGEKTNVDISFLETEYEYSPEGIVISFSCIPEEYAKKAHFEFTSAEDPSFVIKSAPGEKAVLPSGEYIASIMIDETDKSSGAVVQSPLTVVPAHVSIVTPYHKAAYTDMTNPPEYRIEPSWAANFINVEEEYYFIEDLTSSEYTKVGHPKDIGQYFVKLRPSYSDKNIRCELKQFVYEIADTAGGKLSDAEARRSVPSWFKATVKNIETTYTGDSVGTEFTVNPILTECELRYCMSSYGDVVYEYTAELPKEPGYYQVACFASGEIIGEGGISIKKLHCRIELEDIETSYSPEGFVPSLKIKDPDDLDVKFVAYTTDENGTQTGEEVSLPIMKCGRFFIVASPSDTDHYQNIDSAAFVTINKYVLTLDETVQYFEYDGSPHGVELIGIPDWIDIDVEYSEIDADGALIKNLGSEAPCDKGRYMARIAVKSGDNIADSTTFIEMKIAAGAEELKVKEQNQLRSRELNDNKDLFGGITVWSILLISVPLVLIAALTIYLFVKLKKES